MKYGVRVAIGATVGLLLSVGLALWLDAAWIAALAGGLGGPVAFLATFFIWSADRLDEGYEQVLFDKPNSILSGVMLLALVGVALGTGWLAGGPSVDPAHAAALAAMGEQEGTLAALAAKYETANAAIAAQEDAGDVAGLVTEAAAVRTALDDLEVPADLTPAKDALWESASMLEATLGSLEKCVGGDTGACVDARIGYADYTRSLEAYAEAV